MQRAQLLPVSCCLLFAVLPVAHAGNSMSIGSTSGEPGDLVWVPVRGTNDSPAHGYSLYVRFDPETLRLESVDFKGTPAADAPADHLWFRSWPETGLIEIAAVIDTFTPYEKALAPGRDHLLGTIVFRIRATARDGTSPLRARKEILVGELLLLPSEWRMVGGQSVSCTIREGGVLVLPPRGIRPPEIVRCAQEFRDVALGWTNPVDYDEITVDRDGEPIARLPGATMIFVDGSPSQGEHEYGLVGARSDDTSIRVTARIKVGPPRLPAPSLFTCEPGPEGCALKWRIYFPCDRVLIHRDGEALATLSRDARDFLDREITDEAVCYEVRAERDGVLGPPASCVINSTFATRMADVQAEPGSRGVQVSAYATTTTHLQGMAIGLCCESPWAKVTGWTMEGSLSERIGIDQFLCNPAGAGILFDAFPPVGATLLPPGIDLHVASALVDVSPDAPRGSVVRLRLCDTNGLPPIINNHVPPRDSQHPELIDGDLIIGAPPVRSPAALKAAQDASGKSDGPVLLTWRNAGRYDRLTLEREGRVLAELRGSAESYVDIVDRGRIYHYKLRAFRGKGQSTPAVTVFTTLRGDAMFRRGDVNDDGRFLVGDGVRVLEYLYGGRALPGCPDAADANDDGAIDLADAVLILDWLFSFGAIRLPPPGPHAAWFDPTEDHLPCDG